MTSLSREASPPILEERNMKQALRHGWRCKCPNCGRGSLFKSYLKTKDHCPECNESLHHHRADDGPAYLTILIVGHISIPMLGWAFVEFRPEPWVLIVSFSIFSIALSLFLLPRFKGMIVGFQWAKRMHGFSQEIPQSNNEKGAQ